MDVALLAFLIILNGLFAMSEMALTASRKARLQVMVEAGDAGAQAVRHRQQVQVVVAEQAGGRRTQPAQAAQGGQVLRPAVDQVAEHDQVVARG